GTDRLPPRGRWGVHCALEAQARSPERDLRGLRVRLPAGPAPDKPIDALAADDVRAIAVQVRDGLHAILVDGKPDPVPARRAAWYLHRALFPPDARPADTPARPGTMTPAEFMDPSVGDLTGIDCVYLCDLPAPTAELASEL